MNNPPKRKCKPVLQRILRRTEKTATCWLWRGTINKFGYGQIMADRNTHDRRFLVNVHRASWEAHNGPIPAGMFVLHKCDIRNCVNPDHLFLGSREDNTKDMMQKRRHTHGMRHYRAKLTDDQIREIRVSTLPQTAIAKQYGVSQGNICMIRTRKKWRHIL